MSANPTHEIPDVAIDTLRDGGLSSAGAPKQDSVTCVVDPLPDDLPPLEPWVIANVCTDRPTDTFTVREFRRLIQARHAP